MATDTLNWVGTTISNGLYRVDAQLGEGGMGTVYKAFNTRLKADVVIKVPKRAMLEDPEFSKRFEREIRSLVDLQHPHIVSVTDVCEHEGLPIAVMQFLPGGDLTDRQPKDANNKPLPMTPDSVGGWLPGIADALDYIHKKGYIHRDVKPANILFDENGNAYLSDFGVAKLIADKESDQEEKLTGAGMVVGTPEYMAPELIMGEECDGRVDQYALAVTTHEVLCARVPFSGATPAAILVNQTTRNAVPLHELYQAIPVDVSHVVMKGISKRADERYASCADFAKAVCHAIGTQTFEVTPVSEEEIARKETEKNQGATSANPTLVAPPKRRGWIGSLSGFLLSFVVFAVCSIFVFAVCIWATLVVIAKIKDGAEIIPTLTTSWQVWTALISSSFTFLVRNRFLNYQSKKKSASDVARKKLAVKKLLASTARVLTGVLVFFIEIAAVFWLWNSIEIPSSANIDASISEAEQISSIPDVNHVEQQDFTNKLGMRMVFLTSGKFRNEQGEWTRLEVPCWISETEVSVAQYLLYLQEKQKSTFGSDSSANPDWFGDSPSSTFSLNGHPITGIDADEAKMFCSWLNDDAPAKIRYRLPTTKEWVCAYRGGTSSRFYWGESFNGNYANSKLQAVGDNSNSIEQVGRFPAPKRLEKHPWNIFDIAGNAWEFVDDNGSISMRGGSWQSTEESELAVTGVRKNSSASDDVGFRIVAYPSR